MGNNILPRIPEMHDVLDCGIVQGALQSLLGDDYLLHPHRAVHTSTPVEDRGIELSKTTNAPPMGKGSMAGSGWHQDAQSPLARARYQRPWYIIAFYFPHDTPREMGPTRLQAGSYLHNRLSNTDYMILPEFVAAGTVMFVHFDMVHAGFSNLSDTTRYMVKFVFSRTLIPHEPSWNNQNTDWVRPGSCLVDEPLDFVWSTIWHWMSGNAPEKRTVDKEQLEIHLSNLDPEKLDHENQTERLNSIYTLGLSGAKAVGPLITKLMSVKGLGRENRNLIRNEKGVEIPLDGKSLEPRWNERAIVMQDATYALSLSGTAAVPALTELLLIDDPWIQINACYALAEMDSAESVMPISRLLKNQHQQVVRQALDALGSIDSEINTALPLIEDLLVNSRPAWQAREVMRGWSAQNQVRLNAAFTLICAISAEGSDIDLIERLLIRALEDENGYIPAVACEGLSRIGSPQSLSSAVKYLKRHLWDSSLSGMKIY